MNKILKAISPWVVLISAVIFGVVKCQGSDWYRESEKARQVAELAEQTPHKIRSADGCDVYAFKSGDSFHYFTRCAATTTTERNYTVPCGNKNQQRCARKEEITTENVK